MSEYDRLKKIIPPDQALASQALSRSLRQVKKIFDTNLPDVAAAVSVLESNKDLNLITGLEQPLPPAIANFWGNTFPTGTGAGNAVTTNDIIGIAAGNTVNDQLPVVTQVVSTLDGLGALAPLTANAGVASSVNNGIYTQMSYCLGNAYGNAPVVIPATVYWAGGSFLDLDDAFGNGLIPAANSAISNIATTYSNLASESNAATDAIAQQLVTNQNNLVLAGVDVANVVTGDFANANIVANQQSASLSLVNRLHDIGLDISEGGAAQFFDQVANTSTVTGQAVIASMREGRNIAVLNAVGITLDTQIPDLNANTPIANNLSSAQYTTAEARANIVI